MIDDDDDETPQVKPRCTGTRRDGSPCRWPAQYADSSLCLNCASALGDPAALAEQRRRQTRAKEKNDRERTARRRTKVPLSTFAQIREYLERLAALVESSAGDKLQRARAGAALAAQALELLKSDVERQAKELDALLATHPELRARIAAVSG